MTVLTVTLGLLAFFTILIFLKDSFRDYIFSNKGRARGPVGIPIVGHLPFLMKNLPKIFEKWRQIYGNVYEIQLGSWRTIVICGYKEIKEAAERSNDAFSSRPNFLVHTILKECFGGENSLGLGPFTPTYLQHRKMVTGILKHFTKHSKEFVNMLSEEAESLVRNILKETRQPVSVDTEIQLAVGSVMYQLLYGRGENIREDKYFAEALDAEDKIIKFTGKGSCLEVMPWLRYVAPWAYFRYKKLVQRLDMVRKIKLDEHLKMFDPNCIRDIMDAFLATDLPAKKKCDSDQDKLTKTLLLGSCTDLMDAGLETTSSAIRWLLLYMVAFPDVQRRVQREIDAIIGERIGLEMKDRHKMPFTQATILEMLRITSIAPYAVPRFAARDSKFQDLIIHKNTIVLLNIHSVTHEKKFWGDPELFRPERFLDENDELDRVKCSHVITFGLGSRRCPGEHLAKTELFVFFTILLQRCTFSMPDNMKVDFEPIPGNVYRPKPFKVVVTERT